MTESSGIAPHAVASNRFMILWGQRDWQKSRHGGYGRGPDLFVTLTWRAISRSFPARKKSTPTRDSCGKQAGRSSATDNFSGSSGSCSWSARSFTLPPPFSSLA